MLVVAKSRGDVFRKKSGVVSRSGGKGNEYDCRGTNITESNISSLESDASSGVVVDDSTASVVSASEVSILDPMLSETVDDSEVASVDKGEGVVDSVAKSAKMDDSEEATSVISGGLVISSSGVVSSAVGVVVAVKRLLSVVLIESTMEAMVDVAGTSVVVLSSEDSVEVSSNSVEGSLVAVVVSVSSGPSGVLDKFGTVVLSNKVVPSSAVVGSIDSVVKDSSVIVEETASVKSVASLD